MSAFMGTLIWSLICVAGGVALGLIFRAFFLSLCVAVRGLCTLFLYIINPLNPFRTKYKPKK